MRSFDEIVFRLKQELAGGALLLGAPAPGAEPKPLPLPDGAKIAARLRGTPFAASVEAVADLVLSGRFPMLGHAKVAIDAPIRWRRDPVHGQETGLDYFRFIPYLDFARAGDHKTVWELNRHQHLVLLAQAYLLTERQAYIDVIPLHVDQWIEQNPLHRGINWTSALEAAFRALSWIWVFHLVGGRFSDEFRRRFLTALYRHGCHLDHNLSVYFSPNTHLLGEAVALHALGCFFGDDARAVRWRRRGAEITAEQMEKQVRPDGSHFEQSTYYHVYALDMFLFHALIEPGAPPSYRTGLARMAEFLDACVPPNQQLPFIGDDDGGRLFHPYGDRSRFALATLATCGVFLDRPEWIRSTEARAEQAAWWIGERTLFAVPAFPPPPASRLFPDSGLAVLVSGDAHALFDAGAFGPFSGGHSHADTLSLTLSANGEELLIDPGAYTYVSDPELRASFRGTRAHSTVTIDGLDQAMARGPFGWQEPPRVRLLGWRADPQFDCADALCEYAGFAHRRTVVMRQRLIIVVDRIAGRGSEHLVEQIWRLAHEPRALEPGAYRIGSRVCLVLCADAEIEAGWRSRAFASKEPAPVLRLAMRSALPCRMAAAIWLDGCAETPALVWDGDVLEARGGAALRIRFPETGMPEVIA